MTDINETTANFENDKTLSEPNPTGKAMNPNEIWEAESVKTEPNPTNPNEIWEIESVKIMLIKLEEILLKWGIKYELFMRQNNGVKLENTYQVILMSKASSQEKIEIDHIKVVFQDDGLVLFNGCDNNLHKYVVCEYTLIQLTIRSFFKYEEKLPTTLYIRIFKDEWASSPAWDNSKPTFTYLDSLHNTDI